MSDRYSELLTLESARVRRLFDNRDQCLRAFATLVQAYPAWLNGPQGSFSVRKLDDALHPTEAETLEPVSGHGGFWYLGFCHVFVSSVRPQFTSHYTTVVGLQHRPDGFILRLARDTPFDPSGAASVEDACRGIYDSLRERLNAPFNFEKIQRLGFDPGA